MNSIRFAVALSLILFSGSAFAQSRPGAPDRAAHPAVSQADYVEQPLIPRPGDITVMAGPLANPKFGTGSETGLQMLKFPALALFTGSGSSTIWVTQVGAAVGVADVLELGVLTPPLILSPEFGTGNLPLFATLEGSTGDVDMGLRTTVGIPTDTDAHTSLNPGLHMLGRFEGGRLDLGLFFPLVFIGDNTLAALELPVRVTFGVWDHLQLGLSTGLRDGSLGEDGANDLFIPLGAHALYSLQVGDHAIDFTGQFNWEIFFWADAPEGTPDRVVEDVYSISFGANFHLDTGGG